MITLKLFYNSRKISEISLYNRLNLVVGNSGGGKTYFIDRVPDAENGVEPWSISCEKNVIPIRDMPTLNLALNNAKDSLIIIKAWIILKNALYMIVAMTIRKIVSCILMGIKREQCWQINLKYTEN